MTGSINKQGLPSNVMTTLKGKNITEGMYQSTDADTQTILKKIKTIEMKDNIVSIETNE